MNPEITDEDMKTLKVLNEGPLKEGDVVRYTFRGRISSVIGEYSAQDTAIKIMEKIGFKHPTNGKSSNV